MNSLAPELQHKGTPLLHCAVDPLSTDHVSF